MDEYLVSNLARIAMLLWIIVYIFHSAHRIYLDGKSFDMEMLGLLKDRCI